CPKPLSQVIEDAVIVARIAVVAVAEQDRGSCALHGPPPSVQPCAVCRLDLDVQGSDDLWDFSFFRNRHGVINEPVFHRHEHGEKTDIEVDGAPCQPHQPAPPTAGCFPRDCWSGTPRHAWLPFERPPKARKDTNGFVSFRPMDDKGLLNAGKETPSS